MKRPWMPIYIADYLRDTTHLGALESGAYLHLIMDYWQNGGLPSEDRRLARIAKMTDREWKSAKSTLQEFFHHGWKHKRIDQELSKMAEISNKRSAAAHAKHAASRQQNECKTGANADAKEDAIWGANTPAKDDTLHTAHSTLKEPSQGGKTLSVLRGGR